MESLTDAAPPTLQLHHTLTDRTLYVELRRPDGELLAAFPSTRLAAAWLAERGYRWLAGSSGLWGRG